MPAVRARAPAQCHTHTHTVFILPYVFRLHGCFLFLQLNTHSIIHAAAGKPVLQRDDWWLVWWSLCHCRLTQDKHYHCHPYTRHQNIALFTANHSSYALLILYSLSLKVSTGQRPWSCFRSGTWMHWDMNQMFHSSTVRIKLFPWRWTKPVCPYFFYRNLFSFHFLNKNKKRGGGGVLTVFIRVNHFCYPSYGKTQWPNKYLSLIYRNVSLFDCLFKLNYFYILFYFTLPVL